VTKQKLTVERVKNAKPDPAIQNNPTFYWDTELGNFALAVAPSKRKTYVIQYRANHASRRMTIGKADRLTVDEARKLARKLLSQVDQGGDPLIEKRRKIDAEKNTFRNVAERYLTRETKRLRSIAVRRQTIERHLYPTFGSWPITDIRRTAIVGLLDKIEDEHGPTAADGALAALRRVLNWYATTSEDYRSPIVPGMARANNKERERKRILTDDELRAVWKAAGDYRAPWGAYVKFLLLTGCRRNEAARMSWDELSNGTWTIPASRHKSKQEAIVPLSKGAARALEGLPRFEKCSWVFTASGRAPIGGFSDAKEKLDEACGVRDWVWHDLRRTARSLLSRAGVAPDIAERCLTHTIGGVRGVYDRHRYEEEMRLAFEKLAALIDTIVRQEPNVVPMGRRGA
jgi:integrase